MAFKTPSYSAVEKLKGAADLLVAAEFVPGSSADRNSARAEADQMVAMYFDRDDARVLSETAATMLDGLLPFHWVLEFPEVIVEQAGFDAFVGNPPFRSGSRISSDTSNAYLGFIKAISPTSLGNTDLVCYFLLRSARLGKQRLSCLGFITTNSISQGDNRASTMVPLLMDSNIHFALSNIVWPGSANLFVSAIVFVKVDKYLGQPILNGAYVSRISADLEEEIEQGEAFPLAQNDSLGFKGVEFLGDGFKLPDDVGAELYSKYGQVGVVRPWLNGADLTDRVGLPYHYIIDFADMSIVEAAMFPECLEIVRTRVKPIRDKDNRPARRERWWQYGEKAMGMRHALQDCKSAYVRPVTSDTYFFDSISTNFLFTNTLVVVVSEDPSLLTILSSSIHEIWSRARGSSMKTDFRYTPSKCLDTFPFPTTIKDRRIDGFPTLGSIGEEYLQSRRTLMESLNEGITRIYNRFHSSSDTLFELQALRTLHIKMDNAVAAAYGWTDFDLAHGFHETKQGIRFTISEAARREVLARLLKLNHERYEGGIL